MRNKVKITRSLKDHPEKINPTVLNEHVSMFIKKYLEPHISADVFIPSFLSLPHVRPSAITLYRYINNDRKLATNIKMRYIILGLAGFFGEVQKEFLQKLSHELEKDFYQKAIKPYLSNKSFKDPKLNLCLFFTKYLNLSFSAHLSFYQDYVNPLDLLSCHYYELIDIMKEALFWHANNLHLVCLNLAFFPEEINPTLIRYHPCLTSIKPIVFSENALPSTQDKSPGNWKGFFDTFELMLAHIHSPQSVVNSQEWILHKPFYQKPIFPSFIAFLKSFISKNNVLIRSVSFFLVDFIETEHLLDLSHPNISLFELRGDRKSTLSFIFSRKKSSDLHRFFTTYLKTVLQKLTFQERKKLLLVLKYMLEKNQISYAQYILYSNFIYEYTESLKLLRRYPVDDLLVNKKLSTPC